MGGAVSEEHRRETQVSGIPHPGTFRRVPELRGIIAQRTKGTTELRMAVSGDPYIHKHRIKSKSAIPLLCDDDKRFSCYYDLKNEGGQRKWRAKRSGTGEMKKHWSGTE